MPTVLLCDGELQMLQRELEKLAEVRVQSAAMREALSRVEDAPESLDALVLGPFVSQPMQAALRASTADPDLAVMILATRENVETTARAIQFAPFVSPSVRCRVLDVPRAVAEEIHQAATVTAIRRTWRNAVRAANVHLSTSAKPSPPAEFVGSLLEHAPIGVAAVDALGRIQSWNPRAATLFEASEREIIGRPLRELFGPDALAAWDDLLAPGPPRTSVLQRDGGGARRFLEVTTASLAGRSQQPGKLVLLQDVTDRVLAERARERAAEEAREANRAKDEFLAILGHELRNPLAPIFTALALMKMRAGDALVREREIIERQVKHMSGLVDDLLDLSRITRGRIELAIEPVELGTAIGKAIELAAPLLESRRHRLSLDVRSGLFVAADPRRIVQVLGNVLTNAAKYTPKGGNISIRSSRTGEQAEIRFTDDGMGIDAQLLPKLFEPFVQGPRTLDRAEGGLGIGLAIVRRLVELHGGSISAASPGPGRGSTFTITLPLARDEARGVEPKSPIDRPPEPRRVLVVDDNEDAAYLLADVLRLEGHEVRTAFDGPSAITVARDLRPEIAFIDIGLPVMDGYELAKRLKENNPVVLVALTGYGQESDRARSEQAGFTAHLVKPADLAKISEIVRTLAGTAQPR